MSEVVYIMEEGCYSDMAIIGVYSSLELAVSEAERLFPDQAPMRELKPERQEWYRQHGALLPVRIGHFHSEDCGPRISQYEVKVSPT